jgi:hydroxymethylglutaryl-CoA synthase
VGSYVSWPTYTRSLDRRYRLTGRRCSTCGAAFFYPAAGCRQCGPDASTTPLDLPRRGVIVTYTIIEPGGAPAEFADQVRLAGPYAVALVDLGAEVRVLGQITDAPLDQLRIGLPVKAVVRVLYRQEGLTRYSFKFRPDNGRPGP